LMRRTMILRGFAQNLHGIQADSLTVV